MKIVSRLLSLVLLTAFSVTCFAQASPGKTVRVIVAFPPGGSNDIVARVVFGKVAELTGQAHVIDNRGGAGGVIGAAAVAKSPPDGYTIMVHSATHVANAHLRKLPYDTLNDFVGVTTLAEQVFMIVVHPSLPVKSVKELIALTGKRPAQIFYPSGGNGTATHLAMALFESMTGTRMTHVQYKGAAAAVVSLVSGETQAMAANVGVAAVHIRAGRLKALGVTSGRRIKQFPKVPAIAETVRGYDFTGWVGAFVPTGTPATIVEKLNANLGKALADPGVMDRLGKQTMDPMYRSPGAFAQFLKSEDEKYGKLIRATGAKPD
ncbi:MAG: tripartite tricarboxylate transporter substrate binding protein [Betaproteobacteria bacterium]|nr:tripartite tricarboxylate transporter substrate binding protein [Betaproteobacteria bacterium]